MVSNLGRIAGTGGNRVGRQRSITRALKVIFWLQGLEFELMFLDEPDRKA